MNKLLWIENKKGTNLMIAYSLKNGYHYAIKGHKVDKKTVSFFINTSLAIYSNWGIEIE